MIYSFSSVCLEGGEWPQTFFPPPNPAQIQQIATVFPERRLPDSFLPMVEKCFLLTDYRSLSPAITHGQGRPISFISPSLSLSSPGQPTQQAVVWGKLVTPLCLSLADPWYKQVRHEKDEPPEQTSVRRSVWAVDGTTTAWALQTLSSLGAGPALNTPSPVPPSPPTRHQHTLGDLPLGT